MDKTKYQYELLDRSTFRVTVIPNGPFTLPQEGSTFTYKGKNYIVREVKNMIDLVFEVVVEKF
jgi:ethanolamine utilization protein EutA (predicted chaperonin)